MHQIWDRMVKDIPHARPLKGSADYSLLSVLVKVVPRPPGVHEYLKTEFWRDIEIIRGFGKGWTVIECT